MPFPKDIAELLFSYVDDEQVLKGIGLQINAGETVAVVGPTGAGKTSIVSLLSRLYEVEDGSGAILVDGYDVRKVKRKSLVSQMSMVLQDPYLFSGTVRDNIASKAVGAHEFITDLEEGYDTYLMERGSNISHGQRQLISFARAIVADPKILILDEATANIDSHTEVLIQKALKSLLQDRTAIVIAHRLSTIRGSDKIVVVQDGQIAEQGSHDELMNKGGLYSHLYNMNFATMEAPQGAT